MKKTFLVAIAICVSTTVFAQDLPKTKSNFWSNVQFGGGLSLGFGNDFTNIGIAPSAIYNLNETFAFGGGLQYSNISQKNVYSSNIYGANIIALLNPIETIQLSAELEQLRVSLKQENVALTNNFWNTALFVGAGYRTDFATIGIRYNVLHQEDNQVYTTALLPFIRVYF